MPNQIFKSKLVANLMARKEKLFTYLKVLSTCFATKTRPDFSKMETIDNIPYMIRISVES